MNNADKPAYPQIEKLEPDHRNGGYFSICYGGLTKRERFAMAAMQGICANKWAGSEKQIAEESVVIADALLKELDQTPE